MRVLLVANTLPPDDLSGVGEQVLQLASGLRKLGHEVEVLGRGRGGAGGPKVLFPLTVVPPLIARLRSPRPPEVVQVHESDGAFAAFVCRVLGGLLQRSPLVIALLQVSYLQELRAVRPLVVSGRVVGRPGRVERRFRRLKAPLQIALGCLTAWLADLVVAPSVRTAGEIERDYRVWPVAMMPNVTGGLERTVAPVDETDPHPEPYLLFVGRLRIRKGVEVLLEALAGELKGTVAKLVIAGDGEHRAALEERTAALGLGDRVTFLGRQSAGAIDGLLARARALVVPSTYEGMPLVVLEAMEAGVPVIASAVSGIPEVVANGETGWLVPPENSTALARAVREATNDPEEARRRGENGRRRLDRCFRPPQAASIWHALVTGVTGRVDVGDGAGEIKEFEDG